LGFSALISQAPKPQEITVEAVKLALSAGADAVLFCALGLGINRQFAY
jgi:hypothetical protein